MEDLNRRQVLAAMAALGVTGVAMAGGASRTGVAPAQEIPMSPYKNEMFYGADGKFDAEKGKAAYLELMAKYHVPSSDYLKANIWATDFGLGDFVHAGMGGIFWVNEKDFSYFGHEIYLLPGQMIVEHAHVKTDMAPKMESWQARYGWVYLFAEGPESPEAAKLIPESQQKFTTARKVSRLDVGGAQRLAAVGQKHFMMGGTDGAIVTEYATYHDGAGLRFTNPGVKF
ncbi:MAG: hypothetical protein HZB16_11960 [Armatimonadetes bacterium]|nr:hypothetical protein [Armatimonadota bacterium]